MNETVLEHKSRGFLARLLQLSGGDPGFRADAGDLGHELGFALEQTLAVVERLHEQGSLHRCGPLDPPHGPQVHLTPRGVERARQAAREEAP